MTYTYLLDYGHGYMFKVVIEGDKNDIDCYLGMLARKGYIGQDIRFLSSSPAPGKKEKGTRQIECGTVRSCKFKFDKHGTFAESEGDE